MRDTETYILYIRQMTSASSMNEAGCSKLVFWDNLEVGVRREVGVGVQDGGGHACTPVAD